MILLQRILILGLAWAGLAAQAVAAVLRCLASPARARRRCTARRPTARLDLAEPGNALDPKTGRRFFLDYPCDLKPGEKVVFILNIHGAGSIGELAAPLLPGHGLQGEVPAGGGHPHRRLPAALSGPRRCGCGWRRGRRHLQNISRPGRSPRSGGRISGPSGSPAIPRAG